MGHRSEAMLSTVGQNSSQDVKMCAYNVAINPHIITNEGHNLLFRSNDFSTFCHLLPASEQITACSLIWMTMYLHLLNTAR